jgi:small subunit ribosomal protein S16
VAVRIRLTRAGRKKIPHYRIIVMDSRNRRDGAYLDQIGVYHPKSQPAEVVINDEKALKWLLQGAVPSDTVRSLLSKSGIMLRLDLLKRNTPHEKISEAVAKFAETAAARSARRAVQRQQRRPKNATAEATSETPQTT